MTLFRNGFLVFLTTVLVIVVPVVALLLYLNYEYAENFRNNCFSASGQIYEGYGYKLCLDGEGHVLKVPR